MLLHLIGPAVEFVGLLKGSKRFTRDVEKVKKLCGVHLSKWQLGGVLFPNSGGNKITTENETRLQDFPFLFAYSFGKI